MAGDDALARIEGAARDPVGVVADIVLRRRAHALTLRAALAAVDPGLVRGGPDARGFVVGIGGGVAVGKSTVADDLVAALAARGVGDVARVATDDLLLPNAELERRGLTERKGRPETYDHEALVTLVQAVRAGSGPVEVPVYAHRIQDRTDEAQTIDRPAILVLEGLRALAGPDVPGPAIRDLVDLGIYVDADEEDVRRWYLDRFHDWRDAARDDPGALLHRIREMPDDEADALAMRVWETTNAPNVREHVLPTRAGADVVLEKGPDHRVRRVMARPV